RHVKCDGDYPICGNCKSVNGECSYSHPGSKRGYVETIDDRLSKIEHVLTKYLEGADAQQQAIIHKVPDKAAEDPEIDVHDTVNKMNANLQTSVLVDSMSSLSLKKSSRFITVIHKDDPSEINEGSSVVPEEFQQFVEPPLPESYKGSQELPPKDLMDHLIQVFFTRSYGSRAAIIHKPTFIKTINDKNNKPSIFLLNSMMALASLLTDDPRTRTDPEKPEASGDIFFERALSLMDDFMDRARLSTVQALCCLYNFCVKDSKHSCRIWMFIGMAVRMCMDLGLHRDCSKWPISKLEKAIRTRVFWSVTNAEILACASLGKPLPIYDYNTKLPYEIDEDGDEAQYIINFFHHSKLIKIYGNILHSKPYFYQSGFLRNTLPAIDATLSSWLLALPPQLQYNPSTVNEPDPPISPYTAYLHQLYYTVVIALHRPYIDSDEFPNINSQSVCNQAAISITKLCSYIPPNRYTLVSYGVIVYSIAQACSIHLINMSDLDSYKIGKMYMEKCLEYLESLIKETRLGDLINCGLKQCYELLKALYDMQLSRMGDPKVLAQKSIKGGLDDNENDYINVDGVDQAQVIPTPSPLMQQDPIDIRGESNLSVPTPVIRTKKSPTIKNHTRKQSSKNTTSAPSSHQQMTQPTSHKSTYVDQLSHRLIPSSYLTSLPHDSPRIFKINPTPEPSHQFQQPPSHHVQGGELPNHQYMDMSTMVSLGRSLAEPPVVPSSNYYGTNELNQNMIEFSQHSSDNVYLGEWEMIGVSTHHQISNTNINSTVSFNHPSLTSTSSISMMGSSSDSNSSSHQDQTSNYMSFPMNNDHNSSILLNSNHTIMNHGTQDLGER
ncbi:33933_t:CDS:2, partial [Racocetra persica]